VVCLPCRIPDFGRFYGSRGTVLVVAALAKNLPNRSRENEFTTDGFYELKPVKDTMSFRTTTG
jgi:hypothetical protein